MGSIRKAPRTGRWEARTRDPNGRQRTRSFDRRTDAKAFLLGVEGEVRRGNWQDPTQCERPFRAVADEWLASNPRKRPTTYARDANVIRVHLVPPLGGCRMGQIRPCDVQAVIEAMHERGLAPRTVRTNYAILRAI